MNKALRYTLIATALLLLAMATQAQDGPSGELVIALPNDTTSLYGPNGADITAGNSSRPLYDTLLFLDENGELTPNLAESWEISEDGTEYIFTLRQDVFFHNGEQFGADDVIATWEFGKTDTNQYTDIYEDAVSIEALDEFTVRMDTGEPNPLFLTNLSNEWWIIPAAYMNEVGIEGFEQAPIGTGPFRFVERVVGERIVYEANPDYWQEGVPNVERVTFRVISDATTRVAAIQTGEVDIVNRLSVDDALLLEDAPGVNLVSYTNDRIYYVAFKNVGNGVDTPLEDVRVRQALNLAVNRPGIVNGLFGGEATLVSGFTLPVNLGFDRVEVEPFPYDPDRARELLADAGYEDGFQIGLGCPTDAYTNINEVCLAVQRDLAAIGVDVALEFRTTASFWAEPRYGTVGPMYVDSWSSATGEALGRLTGALIPGNYYNTWEDETIVDFIESISTTVDRDARADLYADLQSYMYENPPFIYLYALNLFEATTDRVEGYMPFANEGYFTRFISVSQ
jgi:peptide/nickel transport system substrate-binding protein